MWNSALATTIALLQLTGASVPSGATPGKSKLSINQIQMMQVMKSLDYFYQDCGRYPTTAEGLEALRSPVSSCGKMWGPDPYLKNIPNDPWGRPYEYTSSDDKNYAMRSLGADGREGGEGLNTDVSSSSLQLYPSKAGK